MLFAAIAVFASLMGLVVVQSILVIGFNRALKRHSRKLLHDDQCPSAVVILCLRGVDPFLPRCLRAILQQNYPNYALRIVVDSLEDPAFAIASEIVEQFPESQASIEPLYERLPTCSLKCSSVVQAASEVVDTADFIALIDADTIAHPSWLRELATALSPKDVGAASGNRWYWPHRKNAGSVIRVLWNAAAVVQMYWYRIAWGGTLAVKTEFIRKAGLLDRWSHALCEDTMLFGQLKPVGAEVRFVPSLMMVNEEETGVNSFYHWVSRQLLTARLYHPAWLLVAGHGIITTLLPVSGVVLSIAAIVQSNWLALLWALGGTLAYQLAMPAMLISMDRRMECIAASRPHSKKSTGQLTLWEQAWGIPATQMVYAAALVNALLLRRVEWRGVKYDVRGSWDLRLHEDGPHLVAADKPQHSL